MNDEENDMQKKTWFAFYFIWFEFWDIFDFSFKTTEFGVIGQNTDFKDF